MKLIYLMIVIFPLLGAMSSGLACRVIDNQTAHRVTIMGVAISFVLSVWVWFLHLTGQALPFNENIYTWMSTGAISVSVGFMVDNLTAMMLVVVTFVSLMVHIYSIGYMQGDAGYNRFFSYISLFTFSMLMLVMANNFMQLFFGWEAVGLVSYLLIGFWFKKPSATYANMKAFLVNRVGDFGFILGIACLVYMYGSLNYADVFIATIATPEIASQTLSFLGAEWSLITFACIFLFIGAMGKSAQVPLHVWLPDSMEGPTPISALIHAATMVTAGIFMVARMSPLFELSTTALSFILIIGTITALFMGILGIFQNDIKRVVAYSTLSQLGYMTAALGVSAYSLGVFHLMTHAFFKALLFLGAGSVIIAMHHEQDIRYMGGLRKYMPVTWITSLVGTLALVGFPFFSGFYSKESIIHAVQSSNLAGSGIAGVALMLGVFITALYSFRVYFLVFHGKPRFIVQAGSGHEAHHEAGVLEHLPAESPKSVTIPLILLAVPSVIIGALTIDGVLNGYFNGAIHVDVANHSALETVRSHFHGAMEMGLHGFITMPFLLLVLGALSAWVIYGLNPAWEACYLNKLKQVGLLKLIENKYYFDEINQRFFANGAVALGQKLWRYVDERIIDQGLVYGSANLVSMFAGKVRKLQSGYLYHYAFMMVVGILLLISWVLLS